MGIPSNRIVNVSMFLAGWKVGSVCSQMGVVMVCLTAMSLVNDASRETSWFSENEVRAVISGQSWDMSWISLMRSCCPV